MRKNMTITTRAALAATSLLIWSGVGSAAVFDFVTGSGSSSSALSMTVDGIDLTVTAGSSAGAELVYQGTKGLGVDSGLDILNSLDGFGVDEFLEFDFAGDVKLLEIVFENVDLVLDDDESGLAIDGGYFADGSISAGLDIVGATTSCVGTGPGVNQCTVDLSLVDPAAVGSLFRIGDLLNGFDLDANDNFMISSITVESVTAAVPEPASLGLLLVGALGLGAARRRARS